MPTGPPAAPIAAPAAAPAARADTGGEMVVTQVVARLRIHDFARSFAGRAAGESADRSTCHRSHGACDAADRGARHGACTGSRAGCEVVIFATVGELGVDDFSRALAGKSAGNAADRSTRRRSERTRYAADSRAGDGSARCADAGADFVLLGVAAVGRIDGFAGRVACKAAGDRATTAPAAAPTGPATAPMVAPAKAPPAAPMPVLDRMRAGLVGHGSRFKSATLGAFALVGLVVRGGTWLAICPLLQAIR